MTRVGRAFNAVNLCSDCERYCAVDSAGIGECEDCGEETVTFLTVDAVGGISSCLRCLQHRKMQCLPHGKEDEATEKVVAVSETEAPERGMRTICRSDLEDADFLDELLGRLIGRLLQVSDRDAHSKVWDFQKALDIDLFMVGEEEA